MDPTTLSAFGELVKVLGLPMAMAIVALIYYQRGGVVPGKRVEEVRKEATDSNKRESDLQVIRFNEMRDTLLGQIQALTVDRDFYRDMAFEGSKNANQSTELLFEILRKTNVLAVGPS